MEMKKVLAGWSKVCPGCNIGRKYPDSFIGRKVRNHWEKGCSSHNAYVEVYGSVEPSPKKSKEDSEDKLICDTPQGSSLEVFSALAAGVGSHNFARFILFYPQGPTPLPFRH
jgi:hypothetical protein